jgi:hypothetical protein
MYVNSFSNYSNFIDSKGTKIYYKGNFFQKINLWLWNIPGNALTACTVTT